MTRIATMNVSSLYDSGDVNWARASALLEIMDGIDLLAIQETRITEGAAPTFLSWMKRKGYTAILGTVRYDAAGRPVHGLAWVAKENLGAVRLPLPAELDDDAALAVLVPRVGQRPYIALNIYHSARSEVAREAAVQALRDWLSTCTEDILLIGDWNQTKEQWPLAQLLACRMVYSADDLLGADRNVPTRPGGRLIDFMLTRGQLYPRERLVAPGLADHNLVTYMLRHDDGLRPVYCWPKRPRLDPSIEDEVAHQRFEDYWMPRAEIFGAALSANDLDEAWRILAIGVDETWRRQDDDVGPIKDRPLAPTRRATACQRHAPGSLRIRRVARLLRLAAEYRRKPTDDLKRKICRAAYGARELLPGVPHWSWESDDWEKAARSRVEEWEREAAARRLNDWKERMSSNIRARAKWITQKPGQVLGEIGLDPHPQAAAGRFYEELRAQRAPDGLPPARPDHLLGVVDWASRSRVETPMPQLTAGALAAALRRNRGKAAGVDGLRGEELSRMPPAFFEGIVQLWRVCTSCGRLPAAWL